MPCLTAVFTYSSEKLTPYRVTNQNGVRSAEIDCVPEAFFVWVGEEEFPGLAAVGGLVEAG